MTVKAAAIFRKVQRLRDEIDDEEIWLEQTREARLELHQIFDRFPWQAQVFDTIDCPEPPDWLTDEDKRRDWREAVGCALSWSER
jgi:hypothetical protein